LGAFFLPLLQILLPSLRKGDGREESKLGTKKAGVGSRVGVLFLFFLSGTSSLLILFRTMSPENWGGHNLAESCVKPAFPSLSMVLSFFLSSSSFFSRTLDLKELQAIEHAPWESLPPLFPLPFFFPHLYLQRDVPWRERCDLKLDGIPRRCFSFFPLFFLFPGTLSPPPPQ